MADNRRSFLKKAGGLTAVVAAGPLGLAAHGAEQSPTIPVAAAGPGFLTGAYALELEGINAGFLQDAQGGTPFAEVITGAPIPGHFPEKHLGPLHYEDIELELGLGLHQSVYDWISQALTPAGADRKDGAVQAVDFNFDVVHTREFVNALLAEVGFPAADAASKEPASLRLRLIPEATFLGSGGGSTGTFPRPKAWLASNFRLTLEPLPTARVIKIDAFTVKQQVKSSAPASSKDPAGVEIPNLRVTFSAADFDPWQAWFDDFVLDGNNEPAAELSGKIEWLDPTLSQVLCTVELGHVGIFALAPVPADAGSVARVVADLYVEEMAFTVGPATS